MGTLRKSRVSKVEYSGVEEQGSRKLQKLEAQEPLGLGTPKKLRALEVKNQELEESGTQGS